MAVPFMMPRDEATEDHYRRLERLLRELYLVLRVLFAGNTSPGPATPPSHHHQPPPPQPPAQGPAPGGSHPAQPATPRRPFPTPHRRFPRNMKSPGSSKIPKSTDQRSYWVNLGGQLRDIADDFKASRAPPKTKTPDLKTYKVPVFQIKLQDGTINLIKAKA